MFFVVVKARFQKVHCLVHSNSVMVKIRDICHTRDIKYFGTMMY